jgi:uncharacterized tellurite resistance protein B-like protein
MFGSFKTIISDLVGNTRPGPQAKCSDSCLATAVLLIRVATVHYEMSQVRREKLRALLKSVFGADDQTATQLIEQAAKADRNAVDLYRFTRQLNEVLDEEGRLRTVRMMWEIAYAEGSANEFETNLIWRAADLLGVSSRQRIELRQQVSAYSAASPSRRADRKQAPALKIALGNGGNFRVEKQLEAK